MSDESKDTAHVPEEAPVKATGQKKVNIITSIVLIALGVFIILSATSMKIMDKYAPSSGLFPLMVGILISVLSLSMLIENLNPKKPDSSSKFQNKRGILKSLMLFAGLIVYCILLQPVGYVIDTFVFVLFIMLVIERSKVVTSIITSVGITLMLFLIFQVGLGTTLPQGVLEGVLGF